MLAKEPATLEQLPKSAAAYFAASVRSDVFEFRLLGTDALGRKVYQKTLDGEDYGEPRALLTYREFVAKVKAWANLANNMGVQRWTSPTYS